MSDLYSMLGSDDPIMAALVRSQMGGKVVPMDLSDSEVASLQSDNTGLQSAVSQPSRISTSEGLLSALAGLVPLAAGALVGGGLGAGYGGVQGGEAVANTAKAFQQQHEQEKLPSLIQLLGNQNKLEGASAFRARKAEKEDQQAHERTLLGIRNTAAEQRQQEHDTGLYGAIANTESLPGTPNRLQVQDDKLVDLKKEYPQIPAGATADDPVVQGFAFADFSRMVSKYGDKGKAYLAWHNGEPTVDEAIAKNPDLDARSLADTLPNTGPQTKQAMDNFAANSTGAPVKSISRQNMENKAAGGISVSDKTKIKRDFDADTKLQRQQAFSLMSAKKALDQRSDTGDAVVAEALSQVGRSARFNEVLLRKIMPDTAQGEITKMVNFMSGDTTTKLTDQQRTAMKKVVDSIGSEIVDHVHQSRDGIKKRYPGLTEDFYGSLGADLESEFKGAASAGGNKPSITDFPSKEEFTKAYVKWKTGGAE